MIKKLIILFLVIKNTTGFSQCYNLKLAIKSNTNTVSIDSIWKFQVYYTLENVSDKVYIIDTSYLPNYEEEESGQINFSFYYKYPKKGWALYPTYAKDVQIMLDLFNSSMLTLAEFKQQMQHLVKIVIH